MRMLEVKMKMMTGERLNEEYLSRPESPWAIPPLLYKMYGAEGTGHDGFAVDQVPVPRHPAIYPLSSMIEPKDGPDSRLLHRRIVSEG